MNISRRWLEALLGTPLDAAQVAELLFQRVCPVEAVEPLHLDLGDVLIARVLEVKRHPNADRLSLCQVDAGGTGGPLEVVCGAPNVQAGKTYPFAPVGATLPGGLKLDRRKIRGVYSNGMLCSARELGLGQDHEGILELDTQAAPGTRFLDALPVGDHRIVVEVYANRPDLLGHRGIAREIAAGQGGVVKLPVFPGTAGTASMPTPVRQAKKGVVDGVEIRLEDPEGAPRYMIAVVRGVKVGPSPAWLVDRLNGVGQRSINNIVDATNYILFELNQPMHAFDLARLRGPAVVVRRAKAGEKIKTLDGVERTLTPDMTAICDAERPTIVAGVMGSAESEVTAETTDLVLECAYFQPTRIRRTRRALDLSSDSSFRYERGIDMLAMPDALRRAVELIQAVAGGTLREAPLDLWPEPQAPRSVFLRPERVAHILGVPVPQGEIERLLSSVGFVVAPKDQRLAVQVPGWRPDVTREIDLIEEVARLRGFDSFPDELRAYRPGTVPQAPIELVLARVREVMTRDGFYEARTAPLGPPDGPDAVPVLNPLSSAEAHLRSRMLPGLVRAVEHNWSSQERDVRLFEVGTLFSKSCSESRGGLPDEQPWLGAVLTGARHPPHWSTEGTGGGGAKPPDMDLWDLKRHFELAVSAACPGATVRPAPEGGAGAGSGGVVALWDAVDQAGKVVGTAGRLAADAPRWGAALYGFEVRIVVAPPQPVVYRPLPTQPASVQDLSLVLPGGVSAEQVESVLRRGAGLLLERVQVIDEYRGTGLPAGTRGITCRCTFRDPSRTLRETEVEAAIKSALAALEGDLGVRRRTG